MYGRMLADGRGVSADPEGARFMLLMRGVPDAALRREYRRRLMRVAWRRREAEVIQAYAIKCAMHFHAHRMVQEMLAQSPVPLQAAA